MFVFVIMPFNDDLTRIYADFIQTAFIEEGFEVKRADEFKNQHNILKDIVQGINNADLILAEISEINANVFYELGIAHTLNKPTVVITQNVEALPFDLRSYRVIPYSTKYHEIGNLKSQLKELALDFKQGNVEFGNPVSDFFTRNSFVPSRVKNNDQSKSPDASLVAVYSFTMMSEDVAEFSALITSLGENMNLRTDELTAATSLGEKSYYLIERIFQTTVVDLNNFSKGIENKLDSFKNTWDSMRKSLSGLLTDGTIVDEEDKESVINFQTQTNNIYYSLSDALEKIKRLRNSIIGLNESSKNLYADLDIASLRATDTLEKLIDILSIGQAYVLRIFTLCGEKLSEYDKTVNNNSKSV